MNNKLTKYEQETIINFNREEDKTYIYTRDKARQRHMERKLGVKPVRDDGMGGKEYIVDKDMVRMPQKKRRCSAKSKKELTRRLNK